MKIRKQLSLAATALAFLSSACAQPPSIQIPLGVDVIVFESQPGPFCGRCETTSWAALSDGRVIVEEGYWAGDYRDWRSSTRVIAVGPDHYRRFAEALAPYKPQHNSLPDDGCSTGVYDAPGAIIRWRQGGAEVFRVFDFGCWDDPAMNEAVESAPSLLTGGR